LYWLLAGGQTAFSGAKFGQANMQSPAVGTGDETVYYFIPVISFQQRIGHNKTQEQVDV
jgi:hypothetical protein